MVLAQALEQRNDLRLDGDVERGGGLVGHDELGLGRERERDHHALAHAAAELVRVLLDALLGSRNARFLQQLDGALAGFLLAHRQVGADGLDELPADRVQRVQRSQRVLEDGADLAAADAAHLLAAEVVDALAFEADLAAGHAAGGLEQADDGRARERLAGPGFTDHAQDLAGLDGKRDVVQREQRAVPGGELHPQMVDFEKRHVSAGGGSGRHAASHRAGSRTARSARASGPGRW